MNATTDTTVELPVDPTPVPAVEAPGTEANTVFVQDEAFSEDEVR